MCMPSAIFWWKTEVRPGNNIFRILINIHCAPKCKKIRFCQNSHVLKFYSSFCHDLHMHTIIILVDCTVLWGYIFWRIATLCQLPFFTDQIKCKQCLPRLLLWMGHLDARSLILPPTLTTCDSLPAWVAFNGSPNRVPNVQPESISCKYWEI